MKHYIDTTTKEIYAYESDGSQDAYIKAGLVPISDADLAVLRAPTLAQVKATQNSLIQAQLAAADLKIIRSLAEGDTVRIEAHKASQAALRVQLK